MERAIVGVDGVVQSVGFRPFVYRTATELGLRGTVRNLGDAGVRIELEGDADDVEAFLRRLRDESPPLAQVETVDVERERVADAAFETFEIVESADVGEAGGKNVDDGDRGADASGGGTLPPDTAICDACLADVRDPDSRYHDYWATACVDCGPRFTVVEGLPYDRPTTSMAAFSMCEDCGAEYGDPADRRYHAQAIACPQCGPGLRFGTIEPVGGEDNGRSVGIDADDDARAAGTDTDKRSATGRDPFPDALVDVDDGVDAVAATADIVAGGGIAVVKGVGGAHLICDATDPAAVERLRTRTDRASKPFALMASDVAAVDDVARVSPTEREELTSSHRPIVILEAREASHVANDVAPGLHTVGVMLPYSGVHHLLFDHLDGPLVMTSANMPGRPMLVDNEAIVEGLGDVADALLLHDRRIVARCDDSVARFVDGEPRLVRRSRGFAPTPVTLPGTCEASVLALGPELDVTPAVLAGEDCFLTQYVGDVDDIATLEAHREAIDHLLTITGIERPEVVARDAHPRFQTTEEARRRAAEGDREVVAVQHHHAHAASVLAEHDREAAVAITVDGVGHGPDGTVWGGEVLDATRAEFDRVAGLAPMAMPGGDRATTYPGRMLAGGFFAHPDLDVDDVHELLRTHDVPFPSDEERETVLQQLDSGVNTPATTSAGRFLDAVAALLGVCGERRYEGEPAMRLEAVATVGSPIGTAPPRTTIDGRPALDTPALLRHLAGLVDDGVGAPDVAATAQAGLATGLAELAVEAAGRRGRNAVALSGGVAYNDHVDRRVRERVEAGDLTFLGNEAVPPGDGGVAYGQAAVAAARREWS